MRSKALLAIAVAGMMNNPVLAHMRNVAYSPVKIKDTKDTPLNTQEELLRKAEEKRLRKQQRNLKNANK